jgi:hypothetical protein
MGRYIRKVTGSRWHFRKMDAREMGIVTGLAMKFAEGRQVK